MLDLREEKMVFGCSERMCKSDKHAAIDTSGAKVRMRIDLNSIQHIGQLLDDQLLSPVHLDTVFRDLI